MKTIPISEIAIDDRMRKHYDEKKLADLADSIGRLGLLHAPILDQGKLVCGGRRLKAIGLLKTFDTVLTYQGVEIEAGHVPYTELGEKNEIEVMEAELEENLMRDNLTVQEEAVAKADLHRLRKIQNPDQTYSDTARELDASNASEVIRDSVLIADNLDLPGVAKAGNKKEALKIIKKHKQDEHAKQKAAIFQMEVGESIHTHPHSLSQGDMVTELEKLPEGFVDCICTDPPYGIDAQNFTAQEGVKHSYNDSRDNFLQIIAALAIQGYRICKPEAHAYIFCDFTNWGDVRTAMEQAGWVVWRRPLIWAKGNGLLAQPDYGPRYTYECILFASKGNRKVTGVAPDVISIRTLTNQRRGAEKPAALYHDLLRRSVQPGDVVLDPCCGTGGIFPAANELSCKATGIDIDEVAIGIASERLGFNLLEDDLARMGGLDGADNPNA